MKMARIVAPILLIALSALCLPTGASAGPVTDQLSGDVRRVLDTLTDPRLKAQPDERRQALRAITREVFDLPEMAARSLGQHWQRQSERERERFVTLMGPLVESHLLLLESAASAAIEYLDERVSGERAIVRTRAGGVGSRPLALDYRLVRRGERWQVYDVLVDDVSLVDNYRAQFQKVIRTASYRELVRKLSAIE
jgi:phospholipid transport system substrate-binding protein